MRYSLRLLVLLAVTGGASLLGEAAASAQGYYGPAYGPPRGYYRQPAYAAPYYYGFHTHDGFFMRLNIGAGYLHASETFGGVTDTYSGGGATYGAAFGGAVIPNLIIYGEVVGITVFDADLHSSDGTYSGPQSGLDVTMVGIGPGVAYYIMPVNLYLSGTLIFTQMSFSDNYSGTATDTNVGIGLSLMVGKEWWVGRDWGMGLAGQTQLATMGDDPAPGYHTRMGAAVFSLLFSATYN